MMTPDKMAGAPLPQDADAWGEIAFQRFCTPAASRYRSADHDVLVERARFPLANASAVRVRMAEGDLQTYLFEPAGAWNGASVLLVHGWTSEASFMMAFAEFLRKRGFRIVLFDFPAHGQSTPQRASLIDCAHAVRPVAEALGPIEYVLAHSLGGMAALLAGGGGAPRPRGYPVRAYRLGGMPQHVPAAAATPRRDDAHPPE